MIGIKKDTILKAFPLIFVNSYLDIDVIVVDVTSRHCNLEVVSPEHNGPSLPTQVWPPRTDKDGLVPEVECASIAGDS